MAIRLESGTKVTILKHQPILSPKILRAVTRQFSQNPIEMTRIDRQAIVCQLAGWPTDKRILREATSKLHLPLEVCVLRLVDTDRVKLQRELQIHTIASQIITSVSGKSDQLFHMGGLEFCFMGNTNELAKRYSQLKSRFKDFGFELTIGNGGSIKAATDLREAYCRAIMVTSLAKAFWQKSYMYTPTDTTLLSVVYPHRADSLEVLCATDELIAQLSKPKNLLATLHALFESNLSPSLVARKLRIHRNTVIYRLDKIKQQTGFDPLDFHDALQLRLALASHGVNQQADPPLLKKNRAEPSSSDTFLYMFRGVFNSPQMSDDDVVSWMSSMGIQLPEDFLLCYTDRILEKDVKSTSYICSIEYSDGWLTLYSNTSQRFIQKLAGRINGDKSIALATNKELFGRLGQAQNVLKNYRTIGDAIFHTGCYTQSSIGSFLSLYDDTQEELLAWVNRIMGLLLQPQLVRTAEVLFQSGLNLSTASRRLNMHRNTLIYRIGRIKYYTGYDLTVFADALQLKLAFVLSEVDLVRNSTVK